VTLRFTETADDIDIDQLCTLRNQVEFVAQPRDVVEAQVRGARWVVAAYDDARLVGFVRAISDGVTNAYVCTMVVHADYRGRGIGTELMKRLIADRTRVRWVLHSAERAIAFYERLGFALASNMMRRERG
jgi:ribosomal protein S18 acetylase RimI-like enzyme